MKWLMWIIILFAIAVGLVLGTQYYSGNVYIEVGTWLIRMNLHFFIGIVLLSVVILYILLKIIFGTLHIPSKFQQYYQNRMEHKGVLALNRAGLAYFEGKFQEAELQSKKVLNNKHVGQNKVLALMLAANSADQMDDETARDRYLEDIAQLPAKQQLSRHLLLAESALSKHDYDLALKALEAAKEINPKLTRLVKLQLRYALDQNQPEVVLDCVKKLVKVGAINESEVKQYQLQAHQSLLNQVHNESDLKRFIKVVANEELNTDLSILVAQKYDQLGLYPQLVKWIKKYYPMNQYDEFLPLLFQSSQFLSEKEQQKIMDLAEDWLKNDSQNASLLLFLGQMAFTKQIWGKSQSFLEASLTIEDRIQTRLILTKIYEKMGLNHEADAQREKILSTVEDDDTI